MEERGDRRETSGGSGQIDRHAWNKKMGNLCPGGGAKKKKRDARASLLREKYSSKKYTDGWQESDKCNQCKAPFGIMLRRHHCRRCKKSYCSKHSSNYAYLPGEEGKQRICTECMCQMDQEDSKKRGRGSRRRSSQ